MRKEQKTVLTDQMIAQAAGEYMENHISCLRKEFAHLPPHEFSPGFERKIEKLTRKANHPILYRPLYRVASIILAVLLGSGIWLTFDTSARAAFFGWVREVYETYFVYHFEGVLNDGTEPLNYQITMLPDGYTEFYSGDSEGTVFTVYANEAGEMLKFNYSSKPDETSWFIGVENMTVEKIYINGLAADLIIPLDPNDAIVIMWETEEHTAISLSGFFTAEELISIAESIEAIEK